MPLYGIQNRWGSSGGLAGNLRVHRFDINGDVATATRLGVIALQDEDASTHGEVQSAAYNPHTGRIIGVGRYLPLGGNISVHLYDINLDALTMTSLGQLENSSSVGRIAYHPPTRTYYYASNEDQVLYTLDIDTLALTRVGNANRYGVGEFLPVLVWRESNATMYGFGVVTDKLYTIDLSDSTVTEIDDINVVGTATVDNTADVMYNVARVSGDDVLQRVDPSDASTTALLTTVDTGADALLSGALFHFNTTSPPQNLAVALVDGERRARATWDAPDEVAGDDFVYDIRYREANAPSVWISNTTRAREWLITFAKFDTEYEVQVRARSEQSTSAYVSQTIMTGMRAVPEVIPGVPTNLMATPDGRRVFLTWGPSDPAAARYRVRFRSSPQEVWREFLVYTLFASPLLEWATEYEFQVRGENSDTAVSAYTASVMARTEARPIGVPDARVDIGGQFEHVWEDVLAYSGRFGINRGSIDDLCETMQGQMILANYEGIYNEDRIRPNARIHINHDVGGGQYALLHGWIRSVQPSLDHSTGRQICTITFAGAFTQLARQDYELALFSKQVVGTDDVVNSVLDAVNRDDIFQAIDHGQVRMHPWTYRNILAGRTRGRALAIIRNAEAAEQGYVHEERGDTLTFEHRYRREIDDRLGLDWVFGTGPGEIAPMRTVAPDLGWNHVVNAVTVGAESARVLAAGRIAELGKAYIATNPLVYPGGRTRRRKYNIQTIPNNEKDSNYTVSVVSWAPMIADHITVRRADTNAIVVPSFDDPTADLYIQWEDRTLTNSTLVVRNMHNYDIEISKLELHGTPVAVYGEYTYGPIEDLESQMIYDRQSRDLPSTILSDGVQFEGETTDEGRDFMHAYLAKRSAPRASGKIPFDPLQSPEAENFMAQVKIGDPVTCTAPTGMPPGVYYFEGMEFSFTAYPRRTICTAYVSQKGRSRSIINNAVDVDGGAGWVDVGERDLLPNEDYTVGAWVAFDGMPSDDRADEAMRVLVDDVPVKIWAEEDIPAEHAFFGASIRVEDAATVKIQVKNANTNANRWQVVRVVI